MPLMHTKSVLVLMLMQTSAQALGCSKDVKRGAGFLIWDFLITFCWPFSAQGQVDLGCWTGWDEADAVLLPHAQSQLSRRLWVILAMQVAQDYVCKMLCGFVSSPACGLLGKLFTLSRCYFGLWSSQEAFPEKAEGERNTLGAASDGECFWCACPPALQQPLE